MAELPNIPLSSQKHTGTPRRKPVSFGEGYEQRVMPLNGTKEKYSLKWNKISQEKSVTLTEFLEAHLYVYFTWQNKKWVADKWASSPDPANNWTVSATIRRVYDI